MHTKLSILKYKDKILSTINWTKFNELKRKYYISTHRLNGPSKYFEFDYQLNDKIKLAVDYLNLDQKKNLDVLDISAGFGWFDLVCKYFDHNCFLTDISLSLGVGNDIKIYDSGLECFGLKKNYEMKVKPFEKLPDFQKKFDAIVALGTIFCSKWNINQWKFFIDDLIDNQLKEGKETYILIQNNFSPGCDNFRKDFNPLIFRKEIKSITFPEIHIFKFIVWK